MISGVVAQEYFPLPRGVFKPVRRFDDEETVFTAYVSSGLDQLVVPALALDDGPWDGEEFFGELVFTSDMPQVLTSDAVISPWAGDIEEVFRARVTQERMVRVPFYTDGDFFYLPDIRIPGVLQPPLFRSDDVIFVTPLILDPGMWRAELFFDVDIVFGPVIYAAQTLFPQVILAEADVFYAPKLVAGALGPPFVISDDFFFQFSTQTRIRPELYVDSGAPVQPATAWDGVNSGVNISSDGLNVSLIAPDYYCGARTSITKNKGTFYWEVTVGPSHGAVDQAGLIKATATFTQMTQFFTQTAAGCCINTHVFGIADNYVGGVVISNNAWYCHFGHVLRVGSTDIYDMAEGDVIGIAVDLNNRTAWFRCNGGPWNNNQRGPTALLNQSPITGIGGIPLPDGLMGPAVTLGGQAGSSNTGFAGDNFTANFGAKAYRSPPPDGYIDFKSDSPFGPTIAGDSFGQPVIAIPASFNDGAAFATVTDANLTVTHNTTNDFGGAMSNSPQVYGKYYFEVMVVASHGRNDAVGILISGPEGTFTTFANGTFCANVYISDGAIWSNSSNSGKTLGVLQANDVIGIAVDLTTQSKTQGGLAWFRSRRGAVTGNWNGETFAENADPARGLGGVPLGGFNFTKPWVPTVGFSGFGTEVGDKYIGNFGGTPYAMVRPNGYGVWPVAFNDFLRSMLPATVLQNDTIFTASVDTANKQLQTQEVFADTETVFPARSFGGTLLLNPTARFDDADVFFSPAYFPSFNVVDSPQIALSNNNLTATVVTQLAYTGAKSTAQQFAGKYYFEVKWLGTHGSQDAVGLITESPGLVKNLFDGINCVSYTGNNGISYSNNANLGVFMGTPQNGDVVNFAVNLDSRKVWLRLNGGLWNNNASADPTNGVGGFNIQALVSFAPAVCFNSAPGNAYTINFGVAGFAYTMPSGFTPWPGNSTSQPLRPPFLADNEALPLPKVDPQTLSPGLLPGDDALFLMSSSGGIPTLGPSTVVADPDAIHAPSVAIVLTTLDPGQSVNTTLSNGNLTATHTNTTSDSGARSTAFKSAGKFYFEVTMTAVHGAFDCCGVLLSTATYANLVTNSSNCVTTFKAIGNIWANNAYSGKTLGAIASGDVISFAVDFDVRKVWARKNGGLWNGLALTSENPNTGIGGVAFATGAFGPAIGFGGTGTAASDSMTINFGVGSFAFPVPTGFVTWSAAAPSVLATLDGPATSVTMSGGNLIATHNAAVSNSGVRGTAFKTSGKYYYEATFNATHGQNDCAGLMTSIGTPTLIVSNGAQGFMAFASNGNIWATTVSGKSVGAITAGNVLGYAIDLDARLGWIRKNGGAWNGDPAADPLTGVGGVALYAAPESHTPMACFGAGGTALNDQITLNFGQAAFANLAPAGFGNWVT